MSEIHQSPNQIKYTAEDFIDRLAPDSVKAMQIHAELARLVMALVKKQLALMFSSYSANDVTEIVNQTFLIVYVNFAKGVGLDFSDPPQSLQSYFWCIAHNLCKVYRRGQYRNSLSDSISEIDVDGKEKQPLFTNRNPENDLIEVEVEKLQRTCQYRALDKLKARNADDYELLISYTNGAGKDYQGLKNHRESIAEELKINVKTLAIKIHRIREKVRENFQNCLSAKGL